MTQINSMNPKQAWEFLNNNPNAVLLDVRTTIEYGYVGHPVDAVHIPWQDAPDYAMNPRFVAQVEATVGETNRPLLLLCRSGQRSFAAALALAQAGYTNVVNVAEGFEGDLDEYKHRGTRGGWRFHGLPWEQS